MVIYILFFSFPTEKVRVYVELVRTSNPGKSEPKQFTYMPKCCDNYHREPPQTSGLCNRPILSPDTCSAQVYDISSNSSLDMCSVSSLDNCSVSSCDMSFVAPDINPTNSMDRSIETMQSDFHYLQSASEIDLAAMDEANSTMETTVAKFFSLSGRNICIYTEKNRIRHGRGAQWVSFCKDFNRMPNAH